MKVGDGYQERLSGINAQVSWAICSSSCEARTDSPASGTELATKSRASLPDGLA
jgi:hypothetical protein